ncbi:hypothetical protein Anas_02646 [Armadillidium nasatum]|uniref:WAP domain-containing protein n=1 Tax=Armadillidium nasatum TaxID=96803 RepID=A0A5N5TK04_9CRUS|nr:hypothetical protein Anas_02646 [Armadillidium nasatum]
MKPLFFLSLIGLSLMVFFCAFTDAQPPTTTPPPLPPGCPTPPPVTTCEVNETCVTCEEPQICCPNGCGSNCVDPIIEG